MTDTEKLNSVIATLTILLPRLTAPYQDDVGHCIKLCKEVIEGTDSD